MNHPVFFWFCFMCVCVWSPLQIKRVHSDAEDTQDNPHRRASSECANDKTIREEIKRERLQIALRRYYSRSGIGHRDARVSLAFSNSGLIIGGADCSAFANQTQALGVGNKVDPRRRTNSTRQVAVWRVGPMSSTVHAKLSDAGAYVEAAISKWDKACTSLTPMP